MANQFTKNLTPTNGADAMYRLKTALKAAGWTVPRSSDGTTYNSGGDQITTGTSGAGGMNNASAWFVIQAPTGGRQFMFQRAAGFTYQATIRYSFSAGFTGGTPNSTTPATATDQVTILNSATWYATAADTTRVQIMCDDASPYGFWMTAHTLGATTFQTLIYFDPLNNCHASDTDPYAMGVTTSMANLTAYNGGVYAWFKKGLGGETFAIAAMGQYTLNATAIPGGIGQDIYNNVDSLFPVFYGRILSQGTVWGMKGTSTLFKWLGATRTMADTLTVDSTSDHYVIGGTLAAAYDGTTPSI
jgi:hypothetical protein